MDIFNIIKKNLTKTMSCLDKNVLQNILQKLNEIEMELNKFKLQESMTIEIPFSLFIQLFGILIFLFVVYQIKTFD